MFSFGPVQRSAINAVNGVTKAVTSVLYSIHSSPSSLSFIDIYPSILILTPTLVSLPFLIHLPHLPPLLPPTPSEVPWMDIACLGAVLVSRTRDVSRKAARVSVDVVDMDDL